MQLLTTLDSGTTSAEQESFSLRVQVELEPFGSSVGSTRKKKPLARDLWCQGSLLVSFERIDFTVIFTSHLEVVLSDATSMFERMV